MPGSYGVFIGAAAIGLMLGVSIASGAADSVSGTLQAGTERIALKNVFAVMEKDEMAGGDKEILKVLLSDLPVPDDLHKASNDWFFWTEKQARAGVLHGVILTIDPATGVWDRGNRLTRHGLEFYTESVSSPELSRFKFTPVGPIGDQVAGKVSMKEPMSAMDDDSSWRVEAEFHSAVIRRAAVSGVLTGAAAQNSPQYKAIRAFFEACRKKDLDAIRNSMDPNSRATLAGMIANNKEEALNMFANMAGETAALKLTKVTVRGDSAELEFGDGKPGSESKQILRMVQVNGEGKGAH